MKLLIATTNPGKLEEIRDFLADLPLKLVTLQEANIASIVKESGSTLKENALIKARFYCRISGLPAIADDAGAEIDYFNGLPGVKTRRWIDGSRDSSDEEIIQYTMHIMSGVPIAKRGMTMKSVVALALPDGRAFTTEGSIRGIVALMPSGNRHPGFPFRSLLYLPRLRKFYSRSELTKAQYDKYNHRIQALRHMKIIIAKYLTNNKSHDYNTDSL